MSTSPQTEVNPQVDLVKREVDMLGNEFSIEGARHMQSARTFVITSKILA